MVPVHDRDGAVVMDFGDVISSESSDFERAGHFVNGAVIFYRSDVHFACSWSTVDA